MKEWNRCYPVPALTGRILEGPECLPEVMEELKELKTSWKRKKEEMEYSRRTLERFIEVCLEFNQANSNQIPDDLVDQAGPHDEQQPVTPR